MKTADLPVPGLRWGEYPERRADASERYGPRLPCALRVLADSAYFLASNSQQRLLNTLGAQRRSLRELNQTQFLETLRTLRLALQTEGLREANITRALALVSVACEREYKIEVFDTQLIAADIVLRNGLAEMATSEGKTFAIALAAASAALAGIPVHVVTANDYLVARDVELLRPFYSALGLQVGSAIQGQQAAERHAAYACDITYCTAKELVFDYLRDGMGRERDPLRQRVAELAGKVESPRLLRGLCMAIVDEADSILIDEARVPFILSRPVDNEQEVAYLRQALALACQLNVESDFRLDFAAHSVQLTAQGRERVEALVQPLAAVWRNRLHREESVQSALAALHLYHRDRHYLVRDDKVLIVDDTTGRVAPGRAWSRGLHQLIELKEDCTPTAAQATAAQITYQRFFPRYLRFGGLSGTLRESAAELRATYRRAVQRVPLRCSDRRNVLATKLFAGRQTLWDAVAKRVAELQLRGQPVLVGTDSVADSDALSKCLSTAGIAHTVLNARNDQSEAEVVARAGQRGAVTVATNMAGRGTDISLGEGVADLGGLHVICCQLNASRRIDRQLAGRCARQGDPGSVETWLAIEAQLFCAVLPKVLSRLIACSATKLPSVLVRALVAAIQRYSERRHALERNRLLQYDKQMDRRLSFSGPLE